jgi:dihydrodipicolinate synthase/N-acetylneuraminate lyase
VPRLWCPPLTHFRPDGGLDAPRIARHLQVLSPYVRGVLVPGSTGEGWDLSDAEVRELLTIVLDAAQPLGISILVGVLRHDPAEMLDVIRSTSDWLCARTSTPAPRAAMSRCGVVGFTVCPPRGAMLGQDALYAALADVLSLEHPTAIYQLPQVTGNEIGPETAARLAAEYANFFLLKDTSGDDRIVRSPCDLQGVFTVRGAEGDYARWVKSGGGPYDGFLLSSANCLARDLAVMMTLLDQGRVDEAQRASDRIAQMVRACFEIVSGHTAANPFTNANKILDHVMAFGRRCLSKPAPCVRGGQRLPIEFVERALDVVTQCDLLPARGYMETGES